MSSGAGRTFDVLVVGSGASGGWAAKRLAEAGVDVGLLDAGRVLTLEDYSEHGAEFELKYRDMAPRAHPTHAPPAEGLLRVHGVELRLVPQ